MLSFFENILGLSPFSNRFGCFCPVLFFCPADSNISVGAADARDEFQHNDNSNSSIGYTLIRVTK